MAQIANNLFFEVATKNGTLTFGIPDIPGAVINTPASLTTVGASGRISLVADNYVVETKTGFSSIKNAGTVELAPFSAAAMTLHSIADPEFGGLVVNSKQFANVGTVGTLQVGSFTDVPAGTSTTSVRASSITIDGGLDLTSIAATLRLDSSGSIGQEGNLKVNNLTGSSNGGTKLAGANLIANLGPFTDNSSDIVINNVRPLAVTGAVSAARLLNLTTTGTIESPPRT
jgi:hypothetical protein